MPFPDVTACGSPSTVTACVSSTDSAAPIISSFERSTAQQVRIPVAGCCVFLKGDASSCGNVSWYFSSGMSPQCCLLHCRFRMRPPVVHFLLPLRMFLYLILQLLLLRLLDDIRLSGCGFLPPVLFFLRGTPGCMAMLQGIPSSWMQRRFWKELGIRRCNAVGSCFHC